MHAAGRRRNTTPFQSRTPGRAVAVMGWSAACPYAAERMNDDGVTRPFSTCRGARAALAMIRRHRYMDASCCEGVPDTRASSLRLCHCA
jgi:hypothetical protein